MVSRGHPWSSGRAPSWDCHPWSSGRGAMVVIAYFMGGAAWLGGFHFLSARCSCPVPFIEAATSPARDHTHSNSCIVRVLGVLRDSTSFYLPPDVRFLTLPKRLIELITRLFLSTRPLSRVYRAGDIMLDTRSNSVIY